MYAAILGFFSALPEIVKGIAAIVSALTDIAERIMLQKKIEQAKAALEKAKTGDTSDLEKLFNPDRSYVSKPESELRGENPEVER